MGGGIKSKLLRCKESDIAYGIFVFPCQLQMMDENAGKKCGYISAYLILAGNVIFRYYYHYCLAVPWLYL